MIGWVYEESLGKQRRMSDIELDKKGNVKISPLLEYQTHLASGIAVILRLGYAEDVEDLQTETMRYLQLALTAPQCRALAEVLLRSKSRLEAQQAEIT